MRIIACFLLFVSLSFSATAQQTTSLPWIHFDWQSEDLDGRTFDKAGIMLPIKIAGIPYPFKAQFDLGATVTMLYGNALAPYLDKYPALKSKTDTTHALTIESKPRSGFSNVDIQLDKISFPGRYLGYFDDFGDTLTVDSMNTPTVKVIGTVGPDICNGKVLIIDFPRQRICVTESVPAAYRKASFVPCYMESGRLRLPFTFNEQKRDVLFDTGSSIFSLITIQQNLSMVTAPGAPDVDSLTINSWQTKRRLYSKDITTTVKLGDRTMEKAQVFYENGDWLGGFFKEEKLWGITGNAYFLHNTVIIDYKNNRFGVL